MNAALLENLRDRIDAVMGAKQRLEDALALEDDKFAQIDAEAEAAGITHFDLWARQEGVST